MRVLLVEDDTMAALAIQRELGGHFDLRPVASLWPRRWACSTRAPGAPTSYWPILACRIRKVWPLCSALQAAAPGTPVVVSTGTVSEALRRQLEALSAAATHGSAIRRGGASRGFCPSGRRRSR